MKFAPVMPTFRYKNVDAAIKFLTEALGFKVHARYDDAEKGMVMHAELTFGANGMIMLGTDMGDGKAADGVVVELGHAATYLVVAQDSDVDKFYDQALKRGAVSVREPKNQDYGGRGATIRDPEGHYWSLGSYKPE